jgi:hypothetical protein
MRIVITVKAVAISDCSIAAGTPSEQHAPHRGEARPPVGPPAQPQEPATAHQHEDQDRRANDSAGRRCPGRPLRAEGREPEVAVDQRPGEAGIDDVVHDADDHRRARVPRAAQDRPVTKTSSTPAGDHRDP